MSDSLTSQYLYQLHLRSLPRKSESQNVAFWWSMITATAFKISQGKKQKKKKCKRQTSGNGAKKRSVLKINERERKKVELFCFYWCVLYERSNKRELKESSEFRVQSRTKTQRFIYRFEANKWNVINVWREREREQVWKMS